MITTTERNEGQVLDILNKSKIPFTLMGHVTKGDIRIDDNPFGDIAQYKKIYDNSLAKKLK